MDPGAARLKALIKGTPLWPVLKLLLPKYHGPLARIGTARAKILLHRSAAAARELSRAYAGLGAVHLNSDYLADAVDSCDKAISLDPQSAEAFIIRGDALLRQGKKTEALAGFAGILELRSARAEDHIALADALLRQRDPLEAIRHFQRARTLEPGAAWPKGADLVCDDPFVAGKALMAYYKDQATAAKELALLKAAAEKLEAALVRGESLELWAELQNCYLLSGRIADFLKALQRCFALREQQPAFQEFQKAGPAMEFLPDVCALGIGCMGYIITYIKKKILLGTKERLVLNAPPDKVVNASLLSYFKPHLDLLETPEQIAAVAERKAACELPLGIGQRFGGPAKLLMSVMAEVANRWEQEKRPPLLSLRDGDRERGEAVLRKIGMRPTDWWVCLHVRTSTYYKEGARSVDAYRNADIETYFDAIKSITDRGGHVFRMGDPSMDALPKMERVIDYATSPLRSDWMDVFLCSQCRFYIGTNSGLLLVPNGFGAPSVATNNLPLIMTPFLPDDIFLPKLLRKKDGALMPFREMLKEPFVGAVTQGIYDWSGVEVVSNSREELFGAVSEMLESFDASGKRRAPPLTKLQVRFNELIKEAGISISGRIGADFLRRHEDLL